MKDTTAALRACALTLAAAAATAGCGKRHVPTEAELFGYRGGDLESETNLNYIVSGPGVTNWVPERVVSVVEDYEFSPEELAAVAAASTVVPSAPLAAFPEGWAKDEEGPWFAYWTHAAKAFGLDGTAGVIGHFDADAGVWRTGESYFSSYWKTREEALAALTKVEEEFSRSLSPKKIYRFDGMFVAEYVRLCAMGVVGQKADGRWSCMIDFHDKCDPGCGQWEPLDEQSDRLARHNHAKAMKAWNEACAAAAERNAALVAKAMSERGLAGFPEAEDAGVADVVRKVRMVFGKCAAAKDAASAEAVASAAWAERTAAVAKALGAEFSGEPEKQAVPGGVWWHAQWKSDLFEVRLDLGIPVLDASAEPREPGAPEPEGGWRIHYVENIQPGAEIPPKPELPAAAPAKVETPAPAAAPAAAAK